MEVKWLVILRDTLSVLVGTFGLIHSQLTGQTRADLIAAYVALLGTPGVLQIIDLKRQKRKKGKDTE